MGVSQNSAPKGASALRTGLNGPEHKGVPPRVHIVPPVVVVIARALYTMRLGAAVSMAAARI